MAGPAHIPLASESAAAEHGNPVQRAVFAGALFVGSRAIHLRDLALGRVPRRSTQTPGLTLTPLTIRSGRNLLDAVFAAPAGEPARATVLICHGIGEIVPQWMPIQRLLAARGVASLVFDYSGYGRSTGWPTPAQIENDAVAAFGRLQELAGGPVSLLGLSFGTGVVPAILDRVSAHRLVLCAAFTSFRAAARSAGIPGFLSGLVPPVWASEQALRAAPQRVLLVHSTGDRLFHVSMAEELADWCGERASIRLVDGLGHNEPFYKPAGAYWDPIAQFLLGGSTLPDPRSL
jgi:alpha-beta hydrolase superfamily lysophospholipase